MTDWQHGYLVGSAIAFAAGYLFGLLRSRGTAAPGEEEKS